MEFKPSFLIPALILSATTAMAAHKYDSNKPVTLTGTVTKVEWHKPYVKIHLDAKDADGKNHDWEVQTLTPTVLESRGMPRNGLKEGDQITVKGSGAADGSDHLLARSVTMADGKTVALNGPDVAVNRASADIGGTTSDNTAPATSLPRTASVTPLLGLMGLVSLTAAVSLGVIRRRLS